MAKARITITIYKGGGGWRWRVQRGNTKILAASSEGFATKSGAKLNFKRTRDALGLVQNADLKSA